MSDKVVIVGIDQKSFDELDEPVIFWNGHFAQIIEKLAQARARVIGFDLIQNKVFDKYIAEENQELLEVVTDILDQDETKLVFTYIPDKNLYPFEMLQYALLGYGSLGYANLTVDPDDIIRRQLLYGVSNGAVVPSFALLVCARFLGCEISLKGEKLWLGDRRIPSSLSDPGTMIINFAGSEHTFKSFSFIEVLRRAEQGDLKYFADNYKDKIVLIGVVTNEDRHYTAFESREQGYSLMPGVVIHANTVETILQGNFISEYSPFDFAGLPFLVLLLLLAGLYRKLGMAVGALLTIILLLAGYYLCQALFKHNVVVYYPAVGIGVFSLPLVFYSFNYLLERKEKERIRGIFSSYLNPHVLEDLLKRDNSFLFDVERKKIAIMFSDVRDFTTISQYLEPDEVAELLNEYTEAMFEAIFKHQGTLHQYIGDGIMALWGAPVPDEICCLNALRGAMQMLENLRPLNEKWDRIEKLRQIAEKLGRDSLFKIGIGIHYAEVVVGYIGPQRRMQYTAIGDGVNTASRVEGLNKNLGTELLITEDFYSKVKDKVEAEFLGPKQVKGRNELVDVYKVLNLRIES